MTLFELEQSFRGQWVVLCDPELDERGEVLRGQVAFHGPDRAAAWEEARRLLQGHNVAVFLVNPPTTQADFVL